MEYKIEFLKGNFSRFGGCFLTENKGFIYEMPTNEYRTEWAGGV